MFRVGLIGMGGIARAHMQGYAALAQRAVVTACCDRELARATGASAGTSINLEALAGTAVEARPYTDYRDLLADPEVDVVDICLPTRLHPEVSIAALRAGKAVLCEKPMALTVAECDAMLAAAEETGRPLMIAHCIRFWPEYMALRELVESGRYGKVVYAMFRRLSPIPDWSVEHWMQNPTLSGGSILDLHIHDADFIADLLGLPTAVSAQGLEDATGISHVLATYHYGADQAIFAEGANHFPPGFPFRMTFLVRLEGATVEWDATRGPLTVQPHDGSDAFQSELPEGDGYRNEIDYFLTCVETGTPPTRCTPWSSRETIRLIAAEAEALRRGTTVTL